MHVWHWCRSGTAAEKEVLARGSGLVLKSNEHQTFIVAYTCLAEACWLTYMFGVRVICVGCTAEQHRAVKDVLPEWSTLLKMKENSNFDFQKQVNCCSVYLRAEQQSVLEQ